MIYDNSLNIVYILCVALGLVLFGSSFNDESFGEFIAGLICLIVGFIGVVYTYHTIKEETSTYEVKTVYEVREVDNDEVAYYILGIIQYSNNEYYEIKVDEYNGEKTVEISQSELYDIKVR